MERTADAMIAENEQRLREALLLQDFSPEELAGLTQDELRILAATPYLPPMVLGADRVGDSLGAQQQQLLAALRIHTRRPRTITAAQQRQRRSSVGRRSPRRHPRSSAAPPDHSEM